jgi:hypothetical protein
MAGGERPERNASASGAASGATPDATSGAAPRQDQRLTGSRDQTRTNPAEHSSGSMATATPLEKATISCLTNARYHSGREAWLDSVHRWFMFLVIALGAAALADALPKVFGVLLSVELNGDFIKEVCAAGAAIIAALDLTFDLSNRARAHSMMKRRYVSFWQAYARAKRRQKKLMCASMNFLLMRSRLIRFCIWHVGTPPKEPFMAPRHTSSISRCWAIYSRIGLGVRVRRIRSLKATKSQAPI